MHRYREIAYGVKRATLPLRHTGPMGKEYGLPPGPPPSIAPYICASLGIFGVLGCALTGRKMGSLRESRKTERRLVALQMCDCDRDKFRWLKENECHNTFLEQVCWLSDVLSPVSR